MFFIRRSLTDDHISESFVQDHSFLRLRSLILRCLAVSVYMSVPELPAARAASASAASGMNGCAVSDSGVDVFSPVLRCLIEDLTEHLEALGPVTPIAMWPCVQGPDTFSRLKVRVEIKSQESMFKSQASEIAINVS